VPRRCGAQFPIFPLSRCAAAAKPLADDGAPAVERGKVIELTARLDADGNLLEGVKPESLDAVVSNPPYIPTGVIPGLSPEVLSEPKMALDGGSDGLDVARKLLAAAPSKLKKGGALIMELGEAQAKRLLELAPASAWAAKKTFKDLCGVERFAYWRAHG